MSDLQVRGPQFGATGTAVPFNAGLSGSNRIQDAHGHWFDPAFYGRLFSLSSGSQTIVAANASAGAAGTIAFINGFYNPIGSNVLAAVQRVAGASVSGTPGGPLLYNFLCLPNRLTSAPTGTIRGGILGNSAAGSRMVPLVQVVVATLPADTSAFNEIGPAGGPAAIAAGAGNYGFVDNLDGCDIVPPGCAWGLTSTATGTTHVVRTRIWWEELPMIL
jgi:hypothetical protein